MEPHAEPGPERTDLSLGDPNDKGVARHFPQPPDLPEAPTYADPAFARRLAAALGDPDGLPEATAPLSPTDNGPDLRLSLVAESNTNSKPTRTSQAPPAQPRRPREPQ